MIFIQDGYTTGDDPPGVPLIGYENVITNVTATSEVSGFSASNLLNPATHLFWQASTADPQIVALNTGGDTADYVAIAKHNLSDAGIGVALTQTANTDAVAGYLTLLAHFDGANGSTDYFDSSGNENNFATTATAGQLSTAQFKFGATSLELNGTGYVYTGAISAFGTGAFTIDFWMRVGVSGVANTLFDSGGTGAGIAIAKTAGNVLIFRTGNVTRITGTTTLATGSWYHVALARSGTSTKLFLNGAQEGSTYVDSNSYSNVSSQNRLGANLAGAEIFTGWIDELRILTGSAAFTATFTPATAAYPDGFELLIGNYTGALLHFDGTDASTIFTDDSGNGHVFTAVGSAQLDTAQKQFGTASLLLNGATDYLTGDGSVQFEFGTEPFTIDLWARTTATGNSQILYETRPASADGFYVVLYLKADNKVALYVNFADRIVSTSTAPIGTWTHIALTRSGTSTRLFVNGTQEGGTYTDANEYLLGGATYVPVIGSNSNGFGLFQGHLDEIRIVKGTALWTSDFVRPNRAAGTQSAIGKSVTIEDTSPIIFRFSATETPLQLSLTEGTEAAQIAVIYSGQLLVLERGVKIDAQHRDIVHARQSSILAGMSESGNFLGRVLLSEWRESQAEFAWFTPDWYRENFEPFVASAMTEPFFWAWNPDDYPEETAFAWIIEDVMPETDPATRRIAATISMQAIA